MAETPGTASAKFFFDAYDEKPDLPFFPELSAQAAQTKSTQGNLAALPELFSLGSQVNEYNAGQLEKLLPAQYKAVSDKWSSNLMDLLSGKLSPDVIGEIQRGAAATSLGQTGGGGSWLDHLTARDLGIRSGALQRQGEMEAPGFLHTVASTGVPRPFDITGGFVSPGAQLGLDQYNAEKQFENTWLRRKIEAKADPWKVGLAEGTGALFDTAASMGMGMMGGGMGGGGSTPKYSPNVNAWDTPDYTPGAGRGYSSPWMGEGYGGGTHADWGYVPALETPSYYGPYDPAW